jgi:hypothetical protein
MSGKRIIPIVDITCFGRDIDIDTYASNALIWAKRELVPKESIFCPCLKDQIYLSNKKVSHTINHKRHNQQGSYNEDTIAVLSELEQIIQNAEISYTTTDAKKRQNVLKIIKLKGIVSINDENREVELLIQQIYNSQTKEARYHFYNHVLL